MKKNKIIKFYELLFQETQIKKTEYFAQHLNVSTKTIFNYLNELEYQIQNYNLNICRKTGVGLFVEGSQQEKEKFMKFIINEGIHTSNSIERRELIKEKLVMMDETISIRKLSEEFNVSKTSVVKDIEIIEESLRKKELSLNKSKKGTVITGKEQRIRSAKRRFIYNRLKNDLKLEYDVNVEQCDVVLNLYFNDTYISIAKEMVAYIKHELNFEIGLNFHIQILIQFTIFIERIANGHQLVSTPNRPVTSELHVLQTYPIAQSLCKGVESQVGVEIREMDIRWINARIAGVYHERKNLELFTHKAEVTSLVLELIESVEDVFNSNLREDKILVNGLEKHFVPMISRITNHITVNNPFIEQIKEQYTAMFSVVWLASSIIEKRLGVQLSEDEISFVLIHFQGAMERKNLSKKIAVISNYETAQTQLIVSRIKTQLPTFDVLESFHIQEIKEEDYDTFDLIISTSALNRCATPIIQISPIASDSDIQKIKDVYVKLFAENKSNKYVNLLKALDEDSVCLKKDFNSREEVLQYANEILVKKEVISEGFYESVLAREAISATELGQGIAIPHGLDKYVIYTQIVVITLKNPIIWEKTEVNLIFLLAINFDNKVFSKQLFNNIYHIINSDKLVKKIEKCNTYQQFITLLKEE